MTSASSGWGAGHAQTGRRFPRHLRTRVRSGRPRDAVAETVPRAPRPSRPLPGARLCGWRPCSLRPAGGGRRASDPQSSAVQRSGATQANRGRAPRKRTRLPRSSGDARLARVCLLGTAPRRVCALPPRAGGRGPGRLLPADARLLRAPRPHAAAGAHSPARLRAVLALAHLVHGTHPELVGAGWSQAAHGDACHLGANAGQMHLPRRV